MVPQVLQLNEMQPCWEERLPHCPRYPPSKYIHTNRASSHPTPMQFPPQLCSCLFIRHLEGKCRGLLKLNQTYLLMMLGLPPQGRDSRALWHHHSRVWRSLPFFGQMLATAATSTGENTNCTGTVGKAESGGTKRGHRDHEVEKLQEARGHEKEEGQTENEASLSLLMADCLPAIRAQSWSLIDRLRERRGWERGCRMGA